MMTNLSDNHYCFVCGDKNPRGLKLKFTKNELTQGVESAVRFSKEHQGWFNIVHGGLIATVLDEVMVKVAEFGKIKCVTAEINIKYKKPVEVLKDYKITAKIISIKRKIMLTQASMFCQNGVLVAKAEAKLFLFNRGR